jgi:hypothetical protein
MNIKMKTSILIFLLILTGCGKVRTQRLFSFKEKDYTGIGAYEEPAQRSLTKDELQMANRICTSLKSKRMALEPLADKMVYHFSSEKRNCKNVLIESKKLSAIIRMISGDLEFSSEDEVEYFTNVITDKTDFLRTLCEQVLDTTTALDQKTISNFTIHSNKLFKFSLIVSSDSFDVFQVMTRTQDAKGAFIPTSFEEIVIATNVSQLGANNIGVEKNRSELIPCAGGEFTTKKATWQNSSLNL